MRVLQVCTGLHWSDGVFQFVFKHYEKIDHGKIQFDFLVFEIDDEIKTIIESMGGRVYCIDKPSIKSMVSYAGEIKAFFDEYKGEWDVVHCHEFLIQSFILRNARRIGVPKLILHSHEKKIKSSIFKRIRDRILKIGYSHNANIYCACSVEAATDKFGEKIASKTIVLKNGIDTAKYIFNQDARDSLRKEYGVENKIVIGHIARFDENKNHKFLLELLAELNKNDDKYMLCCIGIRDKKAELMELATSYGQQNNIIVIEVCNDIYNKLNMFDLFVLPSVAEGLGIVLIEAQANGLQCFVSSGVARAAKVTDGFRFIDLTDGVEKWADMISDSDLSRQNVEFMQESEWDINNSVKQLTKLYLE